MRRTVDYDHFGHTRLIDRYCPKCGFADRLSQSKRNCPICRKPFPKRSKAYDELATAKVEEHRKALKQEPSTDAKTAS